MDLVNDAYKSNTSYDSVVRSGMACYEQNPIKENDSKITYKFVPQAFTNAYVEAWNTDEEVYLVIEEINRGNCAQIFGDLFQLLDRKNGVSEYPVEADADLQNYLSKALAKTTRTDIPDDVKSGEKLMLPSNLYIWATMNTSDQSLFPIDSAFKRRWEWKYIKIKEGRDENGNKLEWKVDVKIDETGEQLSWWTFIQRINEIIASMTSSADKQLGYFFCCAKNGVIDEETFVSKVIFYLWNDVFKDYGFEDASLFRYTDKDGKEKDLTFPDFYDEDDEKVNTERLTDFVKKVMSWDADDKRDDDK
ncbi:MAG: AAA family ATPase [Prevotella sp.]|nr:AAA family ATPase [Prevotella sp.]